MNYEPITGELEELAFDPQPSNELSALAARPMDQWGNPDAKDFARTYLVYTTFMGKRIPWHKWGLVPLKAVEADIIASGVKYNFYDVQSYNNRFIAGTHIKSNHAWALAVDINPRENPFKHGGLVTDIPSSVVEAFNRHLFKWGGTYSSVKDAMHFEYLGSPVKAAVPDLPSYEPGSRELKLTSPMMVGTDVRWLQQRLRLLWIDVGLADGVYGKLTRDGVLAAQRRFWPKNQGEWDGICGARTGLNTKLAETLAQYIDRIWLKPRKSRMQGDMFHPSMWEWYGIQPLWSLTILGAETSLGRPEDALSQVNNFGCMKATEENKDTPWGKLNCGTIEVNDRTWWKFPDPWTGAVAWGRLIKTEYLDLLQAGGPTAAAPKYYGAEEEDYAAYLAEMQRNEAIFRGKLEAYARGY